MPFSKQTKGFLLGLILGAAVATQYFPIESIRATLENSSISDPIDLDMPIPNNSRLLNQTILKLIQLEANATTSNASIPDIIEQSQGNASEAGIPGILTLDGKQLPLTYQPLPAEGNNSGLFEGDIILSKPIIGGKAALDFRAKSTWKNGEIPVIFAADVPNKGMIIKILENYMKSTPLTFRLADPQRDPNYVEFIHSNKCASALGMQGGRQVVHVSTKCSPGNLGHEIGHLAGLTHEQSRPDRDKFVDIIGSNIKGDWLNEFKVSSKKVLTDYDYCSLMHYPRLGNELSSKDPKKPIIVPLNKVVGCKDIGQRIGLSDLDKQAISELYPLINK